MAGGSLVEGPFDSTSAISSAIVVPRAVASLWITARVGMPWPRSMSETWLRCRACLVGQLLLPEAGSQTAAADRGKGAA
jgi:hypothetical protein